MCDFCGHANCEHDALVTSPPDGRDDETVNRNSNAISHTTTTAANIAVGVPMTGSGAPVGTFQDMADYLKTGYWNQTGSSTYSSAIGFDTRGDNTISVNLSALDAGGQQLARWAMESWELVADLDFVETVGSAQITFEDAEEGAYASWNFRNGYITRAEVNVPASWVADDGVGFGSYSLSTYIHEIGHALGLGHMGPYNSTADFENDAIFSNDSAQLSVMSYFGQDENPTTNATYANSITPMLVDIIAIQDIYGAPDAQVHLTAGDTVWGRSGGLTGFLDTFMNTTYVGSPTADLYVGPVTYMIYDMGGIDTFDWSDSVQNNYFSMVAGTFSNLYGRIGTVGIAQGTILENALFNDGQDTVIGNSADNRIEAGGGNDLVYGGAGSDMLIGDAGQDTLGAGQGDDTLDGGAGADELWAAAGNDSASGGAGNDTLGGASGNDTLEGGTGDDELWGAFGNDHLIGSEGNDTLGGFHGDDSLEGGAGQDELWGSFGSDALDGGSEDDRVGGFDGDDTVAGGAGDDGVYGGRGNDVLFGDAGDDTLFGFTGDDRLSGGAGADTIYGGEGDDVFVFAQGDESDEILGFGLGDDQLSLEAALWGGMSLTEEQIVSTYAQLDATGVIFDFGAGDVLTLVGLGSTSGLADLIDIA